MPVLLGTAIIPVLHAVAVDRVLSRDSAAALAAHHKAGEGERKKHLLFPRFLPFAEHLLHRFKQGRRKNWLKVSVVPLAAMLDEAEIRPVRQQLHNGNFGKWRSFFLDNPVFRQKIRQCSQCVGRRGVFLERSLDNARFHRIRFDIVRFQIIHIPQRSERQPFAAADFLADTPLHVLHEVVREIFGLAERYLQHKFALRSWLKPKLREAQRRNSVDVHKVDDSAAINRITGETVGVPRQNAERLIASLDEGKHFGELVSPGRLCAFRFRERFHDQNVFSLRVLLQLEKLSLDAHHLLVVLLRGLPRIENAFSFGLSSFHALGRPVGFRHVRQGRTGFGLLAYRFAIRAQFGHFYRCLFLCEGYTVCSNLF